VACLAWLACSLALAPSPAAAQDSVEPSLTLRVDRNLVVREQLAVTATGAAPAGYSVWIFVVPQSSECPSDPSGQPAEAVSIASGVSVGESFSVSGLYRPVTTGRHSFCAYLRSASTQAAVAAVELRRVLPPLLSSAVAHHTVVAALRRHGFAERVVDALDSRCKRRGRTVFACRFKASFRGYELTGRGRVKRPGLNLTYRFRVIAQGKRFVLTERNEGESP
jgi:hypothetical protein